MEFRILGPFEACERGQPLEVGAGRQRALLALLLLRAGEVVSTDRLIDALWGERPPASALNSVHIYVSQLRKVLGDGRLETRGHGYLLALEAEQLDLGRFERLLREGRELLAGGEAERAAKALRAALALWRGPPLADFGSEPFAHGEIARLEELRLAALEERIEADLALGRHADLVPELGALVREQPLRERLLAQLMLALYRSGRQAEALDAYQQARRTLAEELGLQPGPRLHELERAILRQDVQLDPPARAPAPLGRARRRGRLLITIAAALLLVAAIAVGLLEMRPTATAPAVALAGNSLAVIDPASGLVVDEVRMGTKPAAVAVGEGSVWVANAEDETLLRIDPESREVRRTIGLGVRPSDVAVGAGAVWVASAAAGVVLQFDPDINEVVARVAVEGPGDVPGPFEVTAGPGGVWAVHGGGVSRIDSAGRALPPILTPDDPYAWARPRSLAVDEHAAWLLRDGGASVVRIDPRTNSVTQSIDLDIGQRIGAIAVAEGALWITADNNASVLRIDPGRGIVTDVIHLPAAYVPLSGGFRGPLRSALAVGAGAVWVAREDGFVFRIDPPAGTVVKTIELGAYPIHTSYPTGNSVAVGEGALWVAVAAP